MTKRLSLWLAALAGLVLFSACAADNRTPPPASPSPSPAASPAESPSPSPQAKVVTVTIAAGNIDVSETRVEVALNEAVRIEIVSDREDEIHVHGYEIKTPVKPGETTVVEFVADLPGVFEVEVHTGHQKLFELRVS